MSGTPILPLADWRPNATLETLRRRAAIVAGIRDFFAQREVLEVETPALSAATVTDPHLASLAVPAGPEGTLFLQTSPEFAMKRLLAAYGVPNYQIARAFRSDEAGRRHNLEFTLLEWYRPGFDHHRLMDEVEDLLRGLLGVGPAERVGYSVLFRRHVGLDPVEADEPSLAARAMTHGLSSTAAVAMDRDGCLDFLFSHVVQPALDPARPVFVYDFPASQAALARIRPDPVPVAERFEVFLAGMELANGYHELNDAEEQAARFVADLERRRCLGLPEPAPDGRLLAALRHGLPDCAGVALGVDRLVMAATGASHIREVMAFALDRA